MNGQKHTGIEVEFEAVENDWSEYRLKGGGSFRVQNEVIKVLLQTYDRGKKEHHPDGRPKLSIRAVRHIMSRG